MTTGWYPPEDPPDEWCPEEPSLQVELADPPEVLASLLGPDGEPVSFLVSRRQVDFGFQVPA